MADRFRFLALTAVIWLAASMASPQTESEPQRLLSCYMQDCDKPPRPPRRNPQLCFDLDTLVGMAMNLRSGVGEPATNSEGRLSQQLDGADCQVQSTPRRRKYIMCSWLRSANTRVDYLRELRFDVAECADGTLESSSIFVDPERQVPARTRLRGRGFVVETTSTRRGLVSVVIVGTRTAGQL